MPIWQILFLDVSNSRTLFCMNMFGCILLVIHRLNMFWLAWHQSGSRWRVQIFWVSGWQLPGSGPTSDPVSVFSLQQISGTQQIVCPAILQWSTRGHTYLSCNHRWTLGLLGPGSDNVGLWCFIEDLCLYSLSRWHFPGSSVTSASALRHLSNYPPSLHPMSAGPLSQHPT